MLPVYECQKCHHQWVPNKINPKRCPGCQTKNWGLLHIGIEKQHITVNQYEPRTSERSLTTTEFAALNWIAKENNVPTDEVFKQSGSPDFVLKNGKSYEIKTLTGRAVYISENQRSRILKSNPTCQLLIFKSGSSLLVLSIPVADIVPDKVLDTIDVSKHGQIYIKVT